MRRRSLLPLAIGLMVTGVLPGPQVHAQQACDRPTNDFDGLYCLNKVYLQADADLNAMYRKLRSVLPASAQERLRSVQRAWILRRNSTCSRRDEGGFFVNLDCATTMTISRVNFLNDRLRECQSSGCQPSRLR